MTGNPLDRIPSFDRVSIRAVVVQDGDDPSQALSDAGIYDPVAIPIVFGEDQPESTFGDGFTPNLTAALETAPQPKGFGSPAVRQAGTTRSGAGQHNAAGPASDRPTQTRSGTANLPAAFSMQPLAPVRPRGD